MAATNRVVLIVIDMLVDYFERVPALAEQRSRLVARINELTACFRQAGQPVIWVRQEFKADLSDAFLDMKRRGASITIEGTEGCLTLPDLQRAPSDHEIVKKRYSAFFRTDLDSLLSSLEPDTLVLAGINSHACIRTTAIDAYQRDYDVILAADCVASYDQEHHEVSLKYLSGRIATLADNAGIRRLLTPSSAV